MECSFSEKLKIIVKEKPPKGELCIYMFLMIHHFLNMSKVGRKENRYFSRRTIVCVYLYYFKCCTLKKNIYCAVD